MLPCDKKGGDAKFQPSFKYFQENAPDCHKGHVKLQWFWFRMKICENLGLIENLCLKLTFPKIGLMRYRLIRILETSFLSPTFRVGHVVEYFLDDKS